jgi:hypothetical protein
MAGAFWFRVAEVPAVADRLNLETFRASLPAPEHKKAGDLVQKALERLQGRARDPLVIHRAERLVDPPEEGRNQEAHLQIRQVEIVMVDTTPFPGRARKVLHEGWTANDPHLDSWLTQMVEGSWLGLLAQAAELPLGVVEDPRRLRHGSLRPLHEPARDVGVLLAVHGLREQKRGDPAVFVANLRSGLALVRHFRHHADTKAVKTAGEIEADLRAGLDRWLEALAGRPDLRLQALALLGQHEKESPADPRDILRADYLIAENTLAHPEEWLADLTHVHPLEVPQNQFSALGLAWSLPWERERQRRILLWLYEGDGVTLTEARDLAPWTRVVWPPGR